MAGAATESFGATALGSSFSAIAAPIAPAAPMIATTTAVINPQRKVLPHVSPSLPTLTGERSKLLPVTEAPSPPTAFPAPDTLFVLVIALVFP